MTERDALGKFARDTVTGFAGVITGVASYLTGCDQLCLQPDVDDKGDFKDARWFDDTRVLLDINVDPVVVPGASRQNGGPGDRASAAPTK